MNVPPLAQDAKVEKDMKEDRLSDLSETDSEERWSLFSFDYCCPVLCEVKHFCSSRNHQVARWHVLKVCEQH